ncbi:MAG: PQQ-binding-like beta-propeller repeat protein [Candidatus Hadarchaeota archaeon]
MKPTFQILLPIFLVVTVALAVSVEIASGEDWPMYRRDQAHTGYTTSKVPMAPNVLWDFNGGAVGNTPAVVDGMVYFGSWAGAFFALDADNGAQIWKRDVDGWVHTSSPTVAGGKVYFGTEHGGLENGRIIYALNIENGDEVWSKKLGGSVDSSPAVVGEKVFVGSFDGKVHALDAANGNEIWSFQTGDTIYTASPTVVDNTVYIGSWDGKLYALNAADGNLKWSYSTGGTIDSTPAVVNGVLYIGSGKVLGETWAVHVLSVENGGVIWVSTLDYPVRSSPAVAAGKLFIGGGSEGYQYIGGIAENGKNYALSLETGSVLWTYDSPGMYVGNFSPAIADNVVLVTASYKLVALWSENGHVIWERSIGKAHPVISNEKVYTGGVKAGEEYKFYSFGTPAPTIENNSGQKVSGTIKLSGTALGDAVQAVQLNWGSGWVNAASLKLQTETAYNPWGVEYAMNTTRYINNWSHDWNSRSVPNGTNTVRARILYTNGAYSDETMISLQVENFPLDEVQIVALSAGIVTLVVIVLWLKRRWGYVEVNPALLP